MTCSAGIAVLVAAAAAAVCGTAQAQSGLSTECVTSSGYLGSCRPSGTCFGRPTSDCPAGQVCCLRVTTGPPPAAGLSPARPPLATRLTFGAAPARRAPPPPTRRAPPPPTRRAPQSTAAPARRRQTLLDPPFKCGGEPAPDPVRPAKPTGDSHSAIVFRDRRSVEDKLLPTPDLPTGSPGSGASFVAGGAPEPVTTAVGVGVIGVSLPGIPERPSLNELLGRIGNTGPSFSGSSPRSGGPASPGSSLRPDGPRPDYSRPPGPRRLPGRRRGQFRPSYIPGPVRRARRPPTRRDQYQRRDHYHRGGQYQRGGFNQPKIPYQRRNPYQSGRNYRRLPKRLGRPRRNRFQRHLQGLLSFFGLPALRRHRRSPQTEAEKAGFEAVWLEYQERVRTGDAPAGVTRDQLLTAYRAAASEAERSASQTGWTCGAVLISTRYMLTAAHCLGGGRPQVVRLGDRDLASDADGAPVEYRVQDVIPHPEYRYPVVYHDLALLRLDRDVTLSEHVQPFCLYDGARSLVGRVTHVSGWGATEFGGDLSSTLMGGNLTVWARDRCDRVYAEKPGFQRRLPRGITQAVLCAGGQEQDACQGDSGGPMTVLTERGTRLAGVVSAGIGCATPGVPGLYTNVASYIDWIDGVVFGDVPAQAQA